MKCLSSVTSLFLVASLSSFCRALYGALKSEWVWESARRTNQGGEKPGKARGSLFKAVETWIKEFFKGGICVVVMGSSIEAKQWNLHGGRTSCG